MKEVWHQWRGYVSDLTPRDVIMVMTEAKPNAPQELMRLRRNKFKREDRACLHKGVYLVMRAGRNGNGKTMCSISVSKKVWSSEDQHRAEEAAKEYADVFGIVEVREDEDFVPDWASPPGDTIKDVMKIKDMDSARLAEESGIPVAEIEAILQGEMEITTAHAHSLEMLGAPAHFWMERERQYRKDLKRLKLEKDLEECGRKGRTEEEKEWDVTLADGLEPNEDGNT